jgi:hypothetical protein
MKLLFFAVIISEFNGFVIRNILFRNSKHYCNNKNATNGGENERRLTKISIESVSNLFNAYLKDEQQQIEQKIEEEFEQQQQQQFEQQIEEPRKIDTDKNVSIVLQNHNTTKNKLYLETSNYNELLTIYHNFKKRELLIVLQNNKTSDFVKLHYIQHNNWLFDNNEQSLNNGGLMNDWNILF